MSGSHTEARNVCESMVTDVLVSIECEGVVVEVELSILLRLMESPSESRDKILIYLTSESKLKLLLSLQADPHDLTVTTGQSYGVGHSSLPPMLQPISGASSI
jgi:hypothetical protein